MSVIDDFGDELRVRAREDKERRATGWGGTFFLKEVGSGRWRVDFEGGVGYRKFG